MTGAWLSKARKTHCGEARPWTQQGNASQYVQHAIAGCKLNEGDRTEGGQKRPLGEVDEGQVDGLGDDDVGGVACGARHTIIMSSDAHHNYRRKELPPAGVQALPSGVTCRRDSFKGFVPTLLTLQTVLSGPNHVCWPGHTVLGP